MQGTWSGTDPAPTGLTVTGVLLMFYYVPSVERAYTDIASPSV